MWGHTEGCSQLSIFCIQLHKWLKVVDWEFWGKFCTILTDGFALSTFLLFPILITIAIIRCSCKQSDVFKYPDASMYLCTQLKYCRSVNRSAFHAILTSNPHDCIVRSHKCRLHLGFNSQFRWTCYLSLYYDFVLHSGDDTWTHT
jgi:hypothetical protein